LCGGVPEEGFGAFISLVDILVDSGNEFRDAAEGAATEAFIRQFSEPTLHPIEPGRTGRREMETGMPFQPALDTRVLVGSVIVDDYMQPLVTRHLPIKQAEEFQKFLGEVACMGESQEP
jgi:hypothetical protein